MTCVVTFLIFTTYTRTQDTVSDVARLATNVEDPSASGPIGFEKGGSRRTDGWAEGNLASYKRTIVQSSASPLMSKNENSFSPPFSLFDSNGGVSSNVSGKADLRRLRWLRSIKTGSGLFPASLHSRLTSRRHHASQREGKTEGMLRSGNYRNRRATRQHFTSLRALRTCHARLFTPDPVVRETVLVSRRPSARRPLFISSFCSPPL